MNIDVISVLPELMDSFLSHSILKRAQQKELLTIRAIALRPYGIGKHQQVDDYQYGGEAGMVLMCEPLAKCIEDLKKERDYDEIGTFSMTVWHTKEVESEYTWLQEYCRRVGADGMIVLPSDSTGYGKHHGRVLRVMAIKYR